MPASLQNYRSIRLPTRLVEVNRQEEAGLVQQQRVDTANERLTVVVPPGEMPTDDVVGDRKEATVRTDRALDSWFLTDPTHPLVGACGSRAGLACLPTLEAAWVHVVAPSEQGSEQRDLLRWRRGRVHGVSNRLTHGRPPLEGKGTRNAAAQLLGDVELVDGPLEQQRRKLPWADTLAPIGKVPSLRLEPSPHLLFQRHQPTHSWGRIRRSATAADQPMLHLIQKGGNAKRAPRLGRHRECV